MRFHDYHLIKYEVSDGGETITLELLFDYPECEKDSSSIQFKGVALYNFVHTAEAIISNIEETSVSELMGEMGIDISEWSRLYSVKFWQGNLEDYCHTLEDGGYKAWRIESAIGFYGFVIAKTVAGV